MTESDYRQAWMENKQVFLTLCEEWPSPYRCSHRICCPPGQRPGAWWQVEGGMDWRPSEKEEELEYLKRHGLLSEKEKQLLRRNQEEPKVVEFGARRQFHEPDEDDDEDDEDEAS